LELVEQPGDRQLSLPVWTGFEERMSELEPRWGGSELLNDHRIDEAWCL
jgi:hypothetical protein